LPQPCSLVQVQHSTPTSAVGVRLQFYIYASQFCCGRGSIFLWAALDYVPGRWVGELHVVHDAHLFVLQIHISSFGTGWQGEMCALLSALGCREAFHRLGVQDVAELDSD
jgi:hypothetical protein